MNMKLVGMIIGVTISIIMVGFVLTPVINDAVDDTKTVFNNSYGQYSSIMDEDLTISIDDQNNFVVNGQSVTLKERYEVASLVADTILIKTDTKVNTRYLAYYTEETGSVRVNDFASIDVEVSNNIATITYGTSQTVVEVPFTWGFVADNVGDYRSVWLPYTVYLNNIDQIYGAIWVGSTNNFGSFHGKSVMYNGADLEADYNLVSVPGTDNIYSLTQTQENPNFTFVIDNNGSPYTVLPFSCIVPAEINGTIPGGESSSAILYAMPLMFLVAIIATMVIIVRRD